MILRRIFGIYFQKIKVYFRWDAYLFYFIFFRGGDFIPVCRNLLQRIPFPWFSSRRRFRILRTIRWEISELKTGVSDIDRNFINLAVKLPLVLPIG